MNFEGTFQRKKPIIGMIHLAGEPEEKVSRALEELRIYEGEGVDGAIIEDYHGSVGDVINVLAQSRDFKIIRGVNILRDPYLGFDLAKDFEGSFVQFDSVIGNGIIPEYHQNYRKRLPKICSLGGVRFKYTLSTGKTLEHDVSEGMGRCDAIVTTGEGTGIETPIGKLRDFRKIMGDFPLIVGAGVNLDNVIEQLGICDAAIVGSYFKQDGETYQKVDRRKVRDFMQAVKTLR